ncbi:MAG: cytochrome c [Pseudomonadota bacterium]
MKIFTSLSVAALLVTGGPVFATGDVVRGQELSTTCAACHGADGNSVIPTNPKLAGQYDSYLVHALKSYRSGARDNALMSGFAANLSDQDIADLAAYFASQTPSVGVVQRGN